MLFLSEVGRICDAIVLTVVHVWSIRHLWVRLFPRKVR
jgi:hypothetical protein